VEENLLKMNEPLLLELLTELRKDIIKEIDEKYKRFEEELKKIKRRLNNRNPNCVLCCSYNVIKSGKRKTVARGRVQKYTCLDCNRKFSFYNQLDYRMRYPKKTIQQALDLRKEGLSLAQISKKLGNKIPRQTIRNWLGKYQKPSKERDIEIPMKNQYKDYKRKFTIKV
jgi:transposase-like protein